MRPRADGILPIVGCLLLAAQASEGGSVPVDLRALFNNKGIGTRPGEASFDGGRRAYPASAFAAAAPSGSWTSPLTGVVYALPGYTGPRQQDNIVCGGERIPIPAPGPTSSSPFSLSMLIASDQMQQIVTGHLTLAYSDGRRRTVEMRASPAWSFLTLSRGDLVAPYTWTGRGVDGNTSHVFEYTVGLDTAGSNTSSSLASVTLPDTRRSSARIHVFAASLWQADNSSAASPQAKVKVHVQNVRPTQKWTDAGHQVVEVTLNNAGTACFSSGRDAASVVLEGDGVSTVEPGRLKRLCPGDQRRINVGVDGEAPRDANVTVVVGGNRTSSASASWPVRLGFLAYDAADPASLARHESPDWFDRAKYGIFVHWGPYAVPGYGGPPDRETYAEWFWWYSTHHDDGSDPSDTYGYRQRTFGRAWTYDDGFANFTASRWDPRAWVDLFADAGAAYFVLTAKHHDGFALFDTGATSDRSSLRYGPKRDVVKELFDAAREHQPHLKRGTYFSMPEWFNPDFGPYGFGRWPGQLARNPFTGAAEPYTGRRAATPAGSKDGYDYVRDLQLPQMRALAYTYETDILWCDCGPATNATAPFIAEWWNGGPSKGANGSSSSSPSRASHQQPIDKNNYKNSNRSPPPRADRPQPAVNSRCGLPQAADFETPEYATYSGAQRRKWESNRGMDPYSYGFNRATPAAAYMDAAAVVYALVDIVAKNGNLLLDIGPRADGTVVEAEAANLRAAGAWIRAHGEALFGTAYWFAQTEWRPGGDDKGSTDVRFTQTDDAFYVIFLTAAPRPGPDGYVVVGAPVPAQPGDAVSLLAVAGGENLPWEQRGGSSLAIKVSAALLAKDQYGWVFKIAYGGNAAAAG